MVEPRTARPIEFPIASAPSVTSIGRAVGVPCTKSIRIALAIQPILAARHAGCARNRRRRLPSTAEFTGRPQSAIVHQSEATRRRKAVLSAIHQTNAARAQVKRVQITS
ncbi:hypothetical protein [Paraburkholderia sp. Ac-20347]|uniref:hypothetical protein n=1 Tax=Paraburkholderia sp. Ac-20347 TaxID=2703892 RepID=UPI00197D7160|nr:hypothetical protein [Paraburkholderia sp. Ac-20347]MBN3809801.1 hypothetical protein [Paraburkholderia sp. Ac-20347]